MKKKPAYMNIFKGMLLLALTAGMTSGCSKSSTNNEDNDTADTGEEITQEDIQENNETVTELEVADSAIFDSQGNVTVIDENGNVIESSSSSSGQGSNTSSGSSSSGSGSSSQGGESSSGSGETGDSGESSSEDEGFEEGDADDEGTGGF